MYNTSSAYISIVVFSLLVSGCSIDGTGASISGTVETDGVALPSGTIVFSSDTCTCSGRIEEGEYVIFFQGDQSVPIEDYTVTVFPPDYEFRFDPSTNSEEPVLDTFEPALYPERYQSGRTSGLTFTPVAGKNVFAVKLESGDTR